MCRLLQEMSGTYTKAPQEMVHQHPCLDLQGAIVGHHLCVQKCGVTKMRKQYKETPTKDQETVK